MRRRSSVLSIAFAASMLSGCLGSFGTPGEPTGSGTGTGTGAGTGTGSGDGTGNGAQSGGGDTGGTPAPDPTPTMPPAAQGSFAAQLDKSTDTIRLNETKSYMLTLTPSGGLTGGITLGLDNPPAGVSAVFTPATVNITDASPVTVKVDLTVAPTATPTTSASVSVKAVSGTISAAASVGVTVPAELLITIAKGVAIGTAASPNMTAFSGVSTMNVKYTAGMKITFINYDAITHEIHADGAANALGIAHEPGPLMANAGNSYTQTITGPGTIDANALHCHVHPKMIGPKIIFQ